MILRMAVSGLSHADQASVRVESVLFQKRHLFKLNEYAKLTKTSSCWQQLEA